MLKLKDFQRKSMENYAVFDFFTLNTWKYESERSMRAWSLMCDQERAEFNIDVKSIDWQEAESNFIFGIRRFFLEEDILPPES